MLRKDYLVKQFEEFGKVMAVLLGLKRDRNFPDLLDEINKAAKKYIASEISFVESVNNEELIRLLTVEKQLNDEQLKLLGDLLFEKAEYYAATAEESAQSDNCYKKAKLIYLFLKEHATINYSLDMHYKIELLSKMDL